MNGRREYKMIEDLKNEWIDELNNLTPAIDHKKLLKEWIKLIQRDMPELSEEEVIKTIKESEK